MENIATIPWCSTQREEIKQQLQSKEFDILVIGGGVTGAGVAREAQIYGLSCALIDKNDFAFGTSSRSTKMAHGGFRYLKNFELGLVKESVTERNWLRVHFPNLTRPVPFSLIASPEGQSPLLVKFGTFLYDHLSDSRQKFKNFKKHKYYKGKAPWDEIEPEMRKDGILGGAIYYDTNVDDARLTLEIIKEAVCRGAVALNYAKVVDYTLDQAGKIIAANVEDVLSNDKFAIRAKVIVNATGVWTDELLRNFPRKVIRPTKGVHLAFYQKDIGNKNAVAMRHTKDKRMYFVIPRGKFSVVGTTDTDYEGSKDEVYCTKEDADYLIESTKHYFPNAKLDYDHILGTYAGIRPLVMEEGKAESKVSRKHTIFETPDGLVSVCGGKLTIWRKMAEDTLEFIQVHKPLVFPKLKVKKQYSKQPIWIGMERAAWDSAIATKQLPPDISEHLYEQYGKGGLEIVKILEQEPSLGQRIWEDLPWIPAEFKYILDHEMAPHLIDVLSRRMEIVWLVHPRDQTKVAEMAAKIMAQVYNWDNQRTQKEIYEYMDYVQKNSIFVKYQKS